MVIDAAIVALDTPQGAPQRGSGRNIDVSYVLVLAKGAADATQLSKGAVSAAKIIASEVPRLSVFVGLVGALLQLSESDCSVGLDSGSLGWRLVKQQIVYRICC